MNTREIGMLFAFLSSAFPSWKPTKSTINAFALYLRDKPANIVMRAAVAYVPTSKWPPSVGELLALCTTSSVIDADAAWLEVSDALQRGSTEPAWSSPAVKRGVESIGGYRALWWQSISTRANAQSEMGVKRAHFLRIFASIARNETRAVALNEAERIVHQLAGTFAARLPYRTDGSDVDGHVPDERESGDVEAWEAQDA